MTKSNDQSDTKQTLLDAAVIEIAEGGWGALRTRTVAERAGVNKALVHYHFGSMDNLRFEAVATVMSEAVNEASMALLEAPTLGDGIRAFASFLDTFRPDDPRGVVLMEAMIHVPRDARLEAMLLRALEVYEAALRERIAADIASGALPPETHAAGLATALTALLDGLGLHAYVRPDVDFRPAGEALAALFDHAHTPTTHEPR